MPGVPVPRVERRIPSVVSSGVGQVKSGNMLPGHLTYPVTRLALIVRLPEMTGPRGQVERTVNDGEKEPLILEA